MPPVLNEYFRGMGDYDPRFGQAFFDGSFHDHDFGGHHGFDRSEVAARLESAGFADVTVGDAGRVVKGGRGYPVFLAVGRRP